MSGRLTERKSPQEINDFLSLFSVITENLDKRPHYNLAPSQEGLIVREIKGHKRADYARWGLVPHWCRDAEPKFKTHNAQAENILQKPSFSEPIKRQRCLIVADGWYEWVNKQPYYFKKEDSSSFCFTGIYDFHWKAGLSFSMITSPPNDFMRVYHHRMPVLLDQSEFDTWLDKDTDLGTVLRMLRPYEGDDLIAYPVSTMVNNPNYNEPDCIEAVH